MTTKYKLAEEIILRLKGMENPSETEISFQEVMLNLEHLVGSTVREFLSNQIDETQEMDGQLTYTFRGVPIQNKGKKFYAEIPATAITIPMGRGVQEVFFSDNEDEVFKPLPSQYNVLYKGLIGENLDNQIAYYIKEDEIVLKNHGFSGTENGGCGNLTTLDIRMVLPLNGLKEDDYFIMPPLLQEMIIMKSLQYFNPPIPPVDNINDNV